MATATATVTTDRGPVTVQGDSKDSVRRQILLKAAASEITVEQASAALAQLEGGGGNGKLTLKVSEKGGVSLYGVNSKWPVTLYAEQWIRVLEHTPQIVDFIKANASKLKTKGS